MSKGSKGDKGSRGERGDKGIPGPVGTCLPSMCQAVKGEKGETGYRGTCETARCTSIKGERGEPGWTGLAGEKGSKGDSQSPVNAEESMRPFVQAMLAEFLFSPDYQFQFRGPKGDPGLSKECKCDARNSAPGRIGPSGTPGKDGLGMDRIVNYGYGAIIVKNRDDLDAIGHFQSPGSIVLILNQEEGSAIRRDPVMMVKVSDKPNVWRQLNSMFGEEQYLPMSNNYRKIRKPIPDRNNIVTSDAKLTLVLLPEPWRGNIRINEAHAMCQKYAQRQGLPGMYQAFLEDQVRSLKSLVSDRYWISFPIVNKNDEIIFYSWNQMFSGYSRRNGVPLLTFEGHDILDIDPWQSKYMWVGGTVDIFPENVPSCRDWMSSDPTEFGMTVNLQSTLFLNKLIRRPCGNAYYIGCIQLSPDPTLRKNL